MTKTRISARVLAACVSLGMGACGGASLSKTVDLDKLKDMSRQAQIWIYDAENEIVVALDKLDEAKDVLAQVRKRIRHAEARLEAAEKRKNRTGVEMAEEWIKYLEALQRWAKARIEADRVGVVAAQAGVELAKAQVINREDLLAGKGFAVKDYQDQYDEWKKEFETERKRAANLRKTARELEGKWWALRRRFIAQTGDCDSGLWTD